MGLLNDALPREARVSQAEPTVQSEMGSWHGHFTGISEPFEFVSPWGNEKCRVCRGSGLSKDENQDCFLCHGTGKRTEKHVYLDYVLENGVVEREEVNYILTPPRTITNAAGGTTPLSASKLFARLRAISGIRTEDPGLLDQWYSELPQPVSVPIVCIIGENQKGTALKITQVMADRQAQNPPARPPSQTGPGLVRASEIAPPEQRLAGEIQRRQPNVVEQARAVAQNPPDNPRGNRSVSAAAASGSRAPVLPTSDELVDDDWVPGDGP